MTASSNMSSFESRERSDPLSSSVGFDTFAYYLLARAPVLDEQRSGTARAFPLHLTARGRFVPSPGASIVELIDVGRETFGRAPPFMAELGGPVEVTGGIRWLEVFPSRPGYSLIVTLHRRIDGELRRRGVIGLDSSRAPPDWDTYRPHVTLSFADAHGASYPRQVSVSFSGWGLFRYRGLGVTPPISCEYAGTLGQSAR